MHQGLARGIIWDYTREGEGREETDGEGESYTVFLGHEAA